MYAHMHIPLHAVVNNMGDVDPNPVNTNGHQLSWRYSIIIAYESSELAT